MNLSIIAFYLFLTLLFFVGCHNVNEPEPQQSSINEWTKITELSNLSVRYILKFNNSLYISAVRPAESNAGIVYKTNDGTNWTELRSFTRPIGPLTMHGDTLYCLGDSLFRYIIPLNKWENVCQPWPLTSDPQSVSEMIFLKDKLYAMQTYLASYADTYEIHFDGTVKELYMYNQFFYAGAKYIKLPNVSDWCYVRGQYYTCGFFTFNGTTFTELKNGLTSEEWAHPPTNSMAIKNDTLFAGFRRPGSIKYLNNGTWTAYTDTLPLSKTANLSIPWLRTEPTAITFVKNRLFVATHMLGVLEWVKGKGWVSISDGLVLSPPQEGDYDPVVFLESIGNTLVAAYGEPGYAPWGGVGVYALRLN